jgi:hypothetical protein
MRFDCTVMIDMLFLLVWGVVCVASLPAQERLEDDISRQLHYVNYADESTPINYVVIDLNGATAYDDNVLSNNADRIGAMVFQTGAHVGLDEERERFAVSLDYQPEFLVYTKVNGYNQVNQILRLGAKYVLSPHLELRFQNSGYYYTGITSPSLNANSYSGGLPPPSLNNTVSIPLSHEITDEGRLDAVYQMSRRSNFDFFGNVGIRNFSGIENPQENLLNTQAFSGGLAYTYRLTATSTLGISAMHQNLRYGGSLDKIESAFLTLAWQGKSGVTASLYGGPQYVRLNDSLFLPDLTSGTATSFLARETAVKWNGGGGASLGWRSARTVVLVSAQRFISDGGGVFTSVMSTSESFEVRRHLIRHWDLLLTGVNAQSKALSALFGGAVLNGQTGSLMIEREIATNLVAQVGYMAGRQRVTGTYPFQVDMNKNYFSLGLIYRIGRIPLGR